MRKLERSIDIAASPARVWEVIADVERWPEWTASVTRAVIVTGGRLTPGSRVRIHQPKLRPAEWTITDWQPGVRFTWVSKTPGLRVTGDHLITPSAGDAGRCTLTLSIAFEGLIARIVAPLAKGLTLRYMDLEASGAKARSEGTR